MKDTCNKGIDSEEKLRNIMKENRTENIDLLEKIRKLQK